jgi:digeranylgeranylglycerophospholipid reductase
VQTTVDVLVIGLGPAGASAALAAARAGLNVLAVERKKEIGVPVQCAEFIPLPLARYAHGDGVVAQRIAGMNSTLPSGQVVHSEYPGLMIERAAFDQALAVQAQQAGARLQLNSRLVGLDGAASRAQVQTPQGEMEVAYRALIAADGPHSAVARALGLPDLEIVHTRQYTVPLNVPGHDTDIWLSEDYPGGYAWLFPKGSHANLGLGIDKHCAADLKHPLDALHRQLIEVGMVGEKVLYHTGGAIPVGGLRERLAVGNVLFTGDAAGLTHPITGAGIAAAVVSGERAGQACAACLLDDKHDAWADFEEDIRDQFEATLLRGLERRRWLSQHWRTRAVKDDAVYQRGWIAFPEYFAEGQ